MGNASVIMASKQSCGLTMGRARQDSIGVCCVRPMFYSMMKTRIAFGQDRHTGRQTGRQEHTCTDEILDIIASEASRSKS